MATKVLPPHDVLMAQQMRHIAAFLPARKPKRNPNPKPSRKRREGSSKPAKTGEGKRLAEGQVTILQRGEPLDAAEMVGDQKAAEAATAVYAGSTFLVSPSPSSLPLPNFSLKKEVPRIVDCGTQHLRRLLRLE
ncbi:uncharacterized protein [Elaeis guineensis]|uniref:Uncharacterized protein LOC105059917 n=1 Tax=Elaeis guineensis var. tenera TaxID=51953 RepID=A0A6I9SE01_ELAGV|nr:uncharacterized protein LOC105059917 [Elaeis guineensis]